MNKSNLLLAFTCMTLFTCNVNAQSAQSKCDSALARPITIPYSSSDYTCGLGDSFEDTNTVSCGNSSYLWGEDHLYVFTAASSGNIQININSSTSYIGIFVFIGCPNNGSCVATSSGQSGSESLVFYAIAGVTYDVLIDSWATSSPFCIPHYLISIGPPSPPNIQDCLGAIPIRTCIYRQTDTLRGNGNIPYEIDSTHSCLNRSEENNIWYTFTIQQSGDINFVIIPDSINNDYDWAVYKISGGNTCDSIYSNPAMEVSCNYSHNSGFTGANGFSTFTSQDRNGSAFNALIPAITGETFALCVNYHVNMNVLQVPYIIDFCNSTAVIFDSIPPKLSSVTPLHVCPHDTLKLHFSEKIKCSSIQTSDFALSGPGGPYTITGIHSASCDTGGLGDTTYFVSVTPSITQTGTYHLFIDGTIVDLSDNAVITPLDKAFYIQTLTATGTSTDAGCTSPTGSASFNVSGGTGVYSYLWNPTGNTTNSIINAGAGSYLFHVNDNFGCSLDTTILINNQSGLSATLIDTNVSCHGGNNGNAVVSATGGLTPYSFYWSPTGATTSSVSNMIADINSVTISDANGCQYFMSVIITEPPSLIANAGNDQSICFGNSTILGSQNPAIGGTPPYTFAWTPFNSLNNSTVAHPIANPTTNSIYTLTVTDANGCTSTSQTNITVNPLPAIPIVTVNGNLLTSSPALSYQWFFNGTMITGATNQTLTINQFGAYTVRVSDANGCSSYSLPYGYVGLPTINSNFSHLNIYPNPTNGNFNLELSVNTLQHLSISIYNLSGQLVYSQTKTINSGKFSSAFDLSSFAKGIYTIKLTSELYHSNKMIIIE